MHDKKKLLLALVLGMEIPLAFAAPNVLDLSLEDLMNVVITSASKKAQTLAQTAAAAHVITAEDIHNSGASNIPEALRLAPGVQVSALGNNKWAVSIRGFTDRYSNKLLVLVDGRSVYSPLFSGVVWEALDVPLENIARIEVIRGTGAAIWGANAVNGVINIITRSSSDSQGKQLVLAAGTELQGYAYASTGWQMTPTTTASVFIKGHAYDGGKFASGIDAIDKREGTSARFAYEKVLDSGSLDIRAGITRSKTDEEVLMLSAPPASALVQSTQDMQTSHLQARWDNQINTTRRQSLNFFLEHSDYEHIILQERRTTADVEYQYQQLLGQRHDISFGAGFRFSGDEIEGSALIGILEKERDTSLYSAFVQDEITLQPERWHLSVGARLEHNSYTAYTLQPNFRLLWTPNANNSLWLALAQAVRTPSRIERGTTINLMVSPGVRPTIPPSLVQLVTNTLGNEDVDALDVGWRWQLSSVASLDVAGFYNEYDNLRGARMAPPRFVPPGYVVVETRTNNLNSAKVSGAEISLDWRVSPALRLQSSYSWLHANVKTADLPGMIVSGYQDAAPERMLNLRISYAFNSNIQWSTWLRNVSSIKVHNIDEFTTMDSKISWQVGSNMEIALIGQNLLQSSHAEFETTFIETTPVEVERGIYAKIDFKF
jgi:iron complex outermembrane receptor protein